MNVTVKAFMVDKMPLLRSSHVRFMTQGRDCYQIFPVEDVRSIGFSALLKNHMTYMGHNYEQNTDLGPLSQSCLVHMRVQKLGISAPASKL